MATNKRKKGKKRQEIRRRPVPQYQMKAQKESAKEEIERSKRSQSYSLLSLIIMVVGFFFIMAGHRIIGYPITFAGALISYIITPDTMKHKKFARVCCMIYMVLAALLWLSELSLLKS